MEELKTEYNRLLDRYFKATKWFSDSNRTVEDQDKYLSEYKNILDGIVKITLELQRVGIELKDGEYLRGFR